MSCAPTPEQVNTVLTQQASTFREQIMQDIAIDRPYLNTIAGDTWDMAGKGEEILTLVANRVSPAWSRTAPEFTPTTETCQSKPDADEIGQTQYTTKMESRTGKSIDVCVNQAVHLVKSSLNEAYDSMRTAVGELLDYDIRWQYVVRSGVKYVTNSTIGRSQRFTGARKDVGTEFNTSVEPDSPMTYRALINTLHHARNVNGSELFGSGVDAHALGIFGYEQVEKFRNEAQVDGNILAQTNGGYADGNNSIKMYQWTGIQQRGLRLASDQEPLRFSAWDDETGLPVPISPTIKVASDKGFDQVTNPAWITAPYEIGFLVFKNAFKRVVPTRYTGEGQWKFHPQYTMGELVWRNVIDNECNLWGDTGYFLYKVTRAIQAWNPHSVVAIAYQRCDLDDGLEPCTPPISS